VGSDPSSSGGKRVVLPLLTLFATQFPDIGARVMRFLQPVQRLPGS
jgi:hypothetical protein